MRHILSIYVSLNRYIMTVAKKSFVLTAAFISIMLLFVARHHPPSRRKIKQIRHGRMHWEGESNTTMLRSSVEEVTEVRESSTNLDKFTPPKITVTPPGQHLCWNAGNVFVTGHKAFDRTVSDYGGSRIIKFPTGTIPLKVKWEQHATIAWFTCEGHPYHFLHETLGPIVASLSGHEGPTRILVFSDAKVDRLKLMSERTSCHADHLLNMLLAWSQIRTDLWTTNGYSSIHSLKPNTESRDLSEVTCFRKWDVVKSDKWPTDMLPTVLRWAGCVSRNNRRRVVIIQRAHRGRKITNIDAIVQMYGDMVGFNSVEVVQFETLTLKEQLLKFCGSHILLVGIHGGGLAWGSLLGSQSSLIEIGYKEWGRASKPQYASRYKGQFILAGNPVKKSGNPKFYNISVNVKKLRKESMMILDIHPTKRVVTPSVQLEDARSPMQKAQPHLKTKTMIAICAATHSKSNWRSLDDTALQNTLIPSIEKTISTSDRSKYDFRLYLAADHDDQFWLNNQNNVKTPDWLSVHIGFYDVPEHKIPFNPMMRSAYNDGAEYLVRINDDSEFVTSDWVSKAVAKLASYDPPNVGMVGPNCREGNTAIMTHDMVHRTHLDIFEHYYPEVFSAWWIDDWISKVYGPERSTKMMDWTVKHHTHKHGTRYEVQHREEKLLKGELEKGAAKIEKWLAEQASRDTFETPCSEYAPSKYIWDAGIESSESGLEVYLPNNLSKWSMDSHLLSALSKNHRIAYKEIVSSYQQANFDQKITALGKDFSHQRVATIKNAACDTSGLVVDSVNCLVFRNGGCDINKNSKFLIKDNAPKYDKVITIAMPWGSEPWHFVGEALVGLAYVQNIETYKIHVTAKTKFVLEWLRVVGVQEHQIITGTIFAKTLLIPELGKCGNPAPQQIVWLQKKISSYLPDNQQDKHVLVVKRTKSRTQSNWADILNVAKQISPNVVIHDDSNLSSVQQQLENFRNAHTVIAPHGAGLVNIWASRPNTKVIEFMDTTNMNLCYARLAYILGLNYNAIEMKSSMDRVSEVLQRKPPDDFKPLVEKKVPIVQNIPNSLRTTPYEKYKMHSKTVLMASFCGKPINKQHVDCASASQYSQDLKEYSGKETREGRDSCKSQHYFPCKFYSQQGEDSVLFNMFFKQQRNGVYLEMGALDGITYSNTKFFEETLGWSGTLIEASISSYQKLKKNRPKNRLFHNAVCSERKMVTFSGINAEAGIREHMSDAHQKSNRFGDVTSQVQCERLSVLLKGVSKVDLWSLDVEGAEYDVLQSMDWDIPVHVMIIERNPNDLLIEDLLLSKGFNYVREQRGNRIWVNPNYKSLTARMEGAPSQVLQPTIWTKGGHDGMGHVLLGSFSLQLYTRLDKHVKLVRRNDPSLDCRGSKLCSSFVRRIEQHVPLRSPEDKPVSKDHAWPELSYWCEPGKASEARLNRCKAARKQLAQEWVGILDKFRAENDLSSKQVGTAVHIRKGDADWGPNVNSPTWIRKTIHKYFNINQIDIFMQYRGDANEYVSVLDKSIQHAGGDTFDTWLHFIDAKVLYVSASSFTLSAAIFRNSMTVSNTAMAHGGRYDWNVKTCRKDDIWYQIGYGNDDCTWEMRPVQKINSPGSSDFPEYGTFQLHILTMNRAKSLQRLLDSLEQTDYANDRVELHIHIDKSDDNRECIQVAESFVFSHGDVSIEVAEQNNGLRNAWFRAWSPQENERAIILEDDIEVSPQWYVWLKKAWEAYSKRDDLAGISLQRQTLVPQKPRKQMEIVNNHKPFLYRLVGSIGFSPHWKQWRAFLNWIHSVDTTTVDVKTPGLITSDWLDNLDRRHMWTQYFIWFCKQHDLYTLYVNLPEQKTLAAHMREKGKHFDKTEGRDFALATKVSMDFPNDLVKYGWDGHPVKLEPVAGVIGTNDDGNPVKLKLVKDGTNTEYIQLGKIMQARYGFVNIQLLNHGYVEMTKSWICNVRSFPGVLEKTMFITTDQNAYDQLINFDSELNVALELYETPKDLTYGQYAYYDFMLFRTKLLLQLLKNDIVIWLTESDAVWLKDPSDVVLNTKGDMVTMSDGPPPQKILQGGFQLLRPTKPTVNVWTKLLTMFQNKMSAAKKGKEMNDSGSEQLMLNSLIRKEPHLNMQWLDWHLFAPGLYYRDKNKFPQPMIILNNWIKGNSAKIARSKKWNHWYLNKNGQCKNRENMWLV